MKRIFTNLSIILLICFTPTLLFSNIYSWTKQIGTINDDFGSDVAIDSSGYIYVTGVTHGDLDGNTGFGGNDIFLIKYDSSGNKQWTKQFGTTSLDSSSGIDIDNLGYIYLTGVTGGELDGNTRIGGDDTFIIKYSSSGNRLWTEQFGTGGYDSSYGIVLDNTGNIYVTGRTFGTFPGNTKKGDSDIFLVKHDTSTNQLWAKQSGTSAGDYGYGVATDSSGNIYVTGYTAGNLDGNSNAGANDIFLMKYNSLGTKLWTKQFGTSGDDFGWKIAIDSSDWIYITGETAGDLDGNTNAGSFDIFLTKYNTSGTKQWTKLLGTSSFDVGYDVTVDSSGYIYITGNTGGGLDGNSNVGSSDILVVKYDSAGNKLWTKQIGSEDTDKGRGIISDNFGNIYFTGTTYGGLDGNPDANYCDIVLAKRVPYNTPPVLLWTGETNYISDGLSPEIGDANTNFTYRVKYGDIDNDVPKEGYPKVHIKKNNIEITGSPFTMNEVEPGVIYNNGRLYTYTTTLSMGTDYTYYFEAYDVYSSTGIGISTGTIDSPDVLTYPVLSWTGETNYSSDGLHPEIDDRETTFFYKIKYTDILDIAPKTGYPKVHIKKGETVAQIISMHYESGSYDTGAIYSTATLLSPCSYYTYYFAAYNLWDFPAEEFIASSGPYVTNDNPVLSWTGETGYSGDGLEPEVGVSTDIYVYRVKYIDIKNDPPAAGYPKLHIIKSSSEIAGSPFTMGKVSGSYDTGAIYEYLATLSRGTDYTYYFEAYDIWYSSTGSTITLSIDGPDITQPVLFVDITYLDFGEVFPDEEKTMEFTIMNKGEGVLVGTISDDRYWITISPTSFYGNNQTVQVTVTNDGLDDKVYTGNVVISEATATETVTVIVSATCVFTRPNPYNPRGGNKLTFFGSGVPYSTIKIYTLAGELVKTIKVTNDNTEVEWDGRNEQEEEVISGIYLYTTKSSSEKNACSFTIIKK